MWLLDAQSHKLESFEGCLIPPYAILSHQWREDEVTFAEVTEGCHQGRRGWAKIEACCKRAVSEGYRYIWADTCCIDKKSSAELSEAINSMFQWYRNSDVCYAYLFDIQHSNMLAQSEWFTRGWTLQELLAPRESVFFSDDWTCLGSKSEHRSAISNRTRISEHCMTHFSPGVESPASCSIAQIMSWAATRITTRIEDRAYSLMGLFDVNMPLLYGEGRKAFSRLQDEIMRSSNDLSLFAWEDSPDPPSGILAASPDAFSRPLIYLPAHHRYTVTKHALSIETPIVYQVGELLALRVCQALDIHDRRWSGCMLLQDYSSGPLSKHRLFRVTKDDQYMVWLENSSNIMQLSVPKDIEIERVPIDAVLGSRSIESDSNLGFGMSNSHIKRSVLRYPSKLLL